MHCLVMGGRGKVGSAIASIIAEKFKCVHILDKSQDSVPSKIPMDFLHVCIPYSKTFVKDVKKTMKDYKARHVIIHSTVPVGTTRLFGNHVAHSPVRGQHDDLGPSVRRFIKYVGGNTEQTGKECEAHLRGMGLPVIRWTRSEETEVMKLLCLSRFLNDLAFYEVAEKICRENNVAPVRLIEWTWSFNDSYANSDHKRFVRPELTFPKGVAGGTCVFPVSDMLFQQTKNPWLKKNLDLFRPLRKGKK